MTEISRSSDGARDVLERRAIGEVEKALAALAARIEEG